VLRFPETDAAPDPELILLDPAEASELVLRQLGSTALFAAKFRESAARALLLPRRRATGRAPLWAQRKRAYDLLSLAARYPAFPMLLEAYRECVRDVFDMPAFLEVLRSVNARTTRVHVADSKTPSPFAASLLFSYVANYIYDGDAPLAERRAQALSIDQEQLRELLGDADLRELLDADAIAEVEEQLQALTENQKARGADGIHDLLLRLGDLNRAELLRRLAAPDVAIPTERLLHARRLLEVKIAGEKRLIAVEDAARYRDALGIPLPPGLPKALLEPDHPVLHDEDHRPRREHAARHSDREHERPDRRHVRLAEGEERRVDDVQRDDRKGDVMVEREEAAVIGERLRPVGAHVLWLARGTRVELRSARRLRRPRTASGGAPSR